MTETQWKRCEHCQKVSHWDRWKTYEVPHDQLECPECFAHCEAGGFVEPEPPEPKKQKCLICSGSGTIEG